MKITKQIALTLLPVLGLAACDSSDILQDSPAPRNEIRIAATVDHFVAEDGTRAIIEEDGTGCFENGDRVAIFYSNNLDMKVLTYEGEEWSQTGLTWEDMGRSALFTAFFNPTDILSMNSDGNYGFTVQQNQSAEKNYKLSDLLFAQSEFANSQLYPADGMLTLSFTHKMARLRIVLQGERVDEASVASIRQIADACWIKLSSGGKVAETEDHGLGLVPMPSASQPHSYYLLVPPQTLSKDNPPVVTLSVAGQTISHPLALTEDVILESGREHTITLTLK